MDVSQSGTQIIEKLQFLGYVGSLQNEDDLTVALDLVAWLASELRVLYELEESVHPVVDAENSGSFLMELSPFLKELGCPIASITEGAVGQRLATREQQLQLLEYLHTELEAARMITFCQAGSADTNGEAVGSKAAYVESSDAATLRLMMQALGISRPPPNVTEQQVFARLKPEIEQRCAKIKLGKALFSGHLIPDQWDQIEQLNESMKTEYQLRAEMLLKRLDITIQSFAWSDRIKLHAESQLDISDLLAARDDLKHVEKTSSANVRTNTQSRINKVLMKGRVPDRGGRPTKIEPPLPEMPPWQKDRAPVRGHGGQGGHQGGRGGGDRGLRQQGQHGSCEIMKHFPRMQMSDEQQEVTNQETEAYEPTNEHQKAMDFNKEESTGKRITTPTVIIEQPNVWRRITLPHQQAVIDEQVKQKQQMVLQQGEQKCQEQPKKQAQQQHQVLAPQQQQVLAQQQQSTPNQVAQQHTLHRPTVPTVFTPELRSYVDNKVSRTAAVQRYETHKATQELHDSLLKRIRELELQVHEMKTHPSTSTEQHQQLPRQASWSMQWHFNQMKQEKWFSRNLQQEQQQYETETEQFTPLPQHEEPFVFLPQRKAPAFKISQPATQQGRPPPQQQQQKSTRNQQQSTRNQKAPQRVSSEQKGYVYEPKTKQRTSFSRPAYIATVLGRPHIDCWLTMGANTNQCARCWLFGHIARECREIACDRAVALDEFRQQRHQFNARNDLPMNTRMPKDENSNVQGWHHHR